MAALSEWIALFLMGYVVIALFYVAAGTKTALTLASTDGELQSARNALGQNYRARFLWLKRYRAQLPNEVQVIAGRAVAVEISCWAAMVVLFLIYGLQFVAL